MQQLYPKHQNALLMPLIAHVPYRAHIAGGDENDSFSAASIDDTAYLIVQLLLNILHNQATDVSAIHNPAIIGSRIISPSA